VEISVIILGISNSLRVHVVIPNGFNVMDSKNPIPQTTTSSGGGRIEYRNPLNNLFFNVNYSLSDSKKTF
jgi:hypothetical protein